MKIRDLIENLQQMDPDLDVMVYTGVDGVVNAGHLEGIALIGFTGDTQEHAALASGGAMDLMPAGPATH